MDMPTSPLYKRLAAHYRDAIRAGALAPGERMPSLRSLMRLHPISLSTALQLCRELEDDGWLEARDRSGYFVRAPRAPRIAPVNEPRPGRAPDPAQYVGIHARVSAFVAQRRAARRSRSTSRSPARRRSSTRPRRCAPPWPRAAPAPRPAGGAPPQQRGDAGFRAVLARRALAAGMTLAPDDILVTNGCIEALNLALRAVAQPGDTIAVESPTFYGLLQVLESLGLRALEIPTSPQTGLSLEALELALHTYGDIKAVVVVPHLQNPLGSVMPDAHKQAAGALCEQRGIALIEDDTYSELLDSADARCAPSSPGTSAGSVIHCASLHKILAPGMRLGWIAAGAGRRASRCSSTRRRATTRACRRSAPASSWPPAPTTGTCAACAPRCGTQREQTAEAIARYFPPGTRMNVPPGGLQLWVELPDKLLGQPPVRGGAGRAAS